MCDSTCCFEPTFTLKGILILSDGCQASVCSGRQSIGWGYPPSFARSQNTGNGILGIFAKDKVWIDERIFVYKRIIRYGR